MLGNEQFLLFNTNTSLYLLFVSSEDCYQSTRVAVTKYHRLGGLNNRNLFYHSSRDQESRSRCGWSWFLLRYFFLTCRWPPSRCVFTWTLHVQREIELSAVSSSYKDTRPTDQSATLMTPFNHNYLHKDLKGSGVPIQSCQGFKVQSITGLLVEVGLSSQYLFGDLGSQGLSPCPSLLPQLLLNSPWLTLQPQVNFFPISGVLYQLPSLSGLLFHGWFLLSLQTLTDHPF